MGTEGGAEGMRREGQARERGGHAGGWCGRCMGAACVRCCIHTIHTRKREGGTITSRTSSTCSCPLGCGGIHTYSHHPHTCMRMRGGRCGSASTRLTRRSYSLTLGLLVTSLFRPSLLCTGGGAGLSYLRGEWRAVHTCCLLQGGGAGGTALGEGWEGAARKVHPQNILAEHDAHILVHA